MAFLAQFYSMPPRLDFGAFAGIQLYQCSDIDGGCSPVPLLVSLSPGALLNTECSGTIAFGITPCGIDWEYADDPDEIGEKEMMEQEGLRLFQSKAGGAMPLIDVLPRKVKCIMQLNQYPVGFNFGGFSAAVCRTPEALAVFLV